MPRIDAVCSSEIFFVKFMFHQIIGNTSIMAKDYNVAMLLHLKSLSRGIKSFYLRDVIRVLYNWIAFVSIKKVNDAPAKSERNSGSSEAGFIFNDAFISHSNDHPLMIFLLTHSYSPYEHENFLNQREVYQGYNHGRS